MIDPRARMNNFKDAAIADGWFCKEDENPVKLTKDGFLIHIYIKSLTPAIFIWGPDRLDVECPNEYNFQEIVKNLRNCGYCKKEDVDTFRVGFAGRCCKECLPAKKKEFEYPGWCS